MKPSVLICLFTIALFFLGCSQTSENNETLELKLIYKVGDEQTIISITETKGNSLISIRDEMEATFTVTSIEKEIGYTFNTDIIGIRYDSKMGDEVEHYDSRKKESNMTTDEMNTHTDFKDVLDNNFLISINEKGNITKPFYYQNGNTAPDGILPMNNIQLTFPDKKVGIGSEWQNESKNPITGQTISSTYKIKDITTDKIIISVKSKIPAIGNVLEANEAIGEYELDRTTCRLIKGQKEMNLLRGGKAVYKYYTK